MAAPTASPASSRRPFTISARATATPSVSGTSVTAAREYATSIVQTATTAAATTPVPYARRPSHHAAAIAPSEMTTSTILAVKNDGELCHAWNGAFTYINSVG